MHMPDYRRAKIAGGTFFFTLTLADRSSDLLVREIERLRRVYIHVREHKLFKTVAICILPDHLHAIWSLPAGDSDFARRWSLIKAGFSRGLPAASSSSSLTRKREKGIGQRRYWEHAIRNNHDLKQHVAYIHFNPALGRLRRETHYRPFTLRTITWWARRVPPAAATPLPTLHFRPNRSALAAFAVDGEFARHVGAPEVE
jgi:REP-associated tyrosine transposase